MKRSGRLHNRAPSHFAFRKPYEFAAISIRWQKTFSYIQNARSYSTTTNTITTPNFGTIPMPDVGSPDAQHHDVSNVQMESVADITVAALRGPWLMVFPASESTAKPLPSGELMVEASGVVYFRPGSALGYGVGRIDLASDGSFTMALETYLYEQTSKFPPSDAESFALRGVVQRAVIGSHGAAILTFNGTVSHARDASVHYQFQAAKMDGWSDEAHAASAFRPDRALTEKLELVIPPMAAFPPRRKIDFDKYRVGSVPNIYYVPNWVSAAEEGTMLKILKGTPREAKQQLDRRLVQEYGGTMCSTCNTSFVAEGNVPTWCGQISDGLLQAGVFTPSTFPNNVRIHEYEADEGIAPHVDGPIYVPNVAILSLASSCVMSFYPRREPYDNPMDHYNDTFKFDGEIARQTPMCSVVLEPRSLLVFSHDVYWYHPHGIRAESTDPLGETTAGPIVNAHLLSGKMEKSLPRTYRVGVTIRNLLPRCNHQPARAEYFMGEAFAKLHGVPQAPAKPPAKPAQTPQPKNTTSVPIAPEPPKRGLGLPNIRKDAAMPRTEFPSTLKPSAPPTQPERPLQGVIENEMTDLGVKPQQTSYVQPSVPQPTFMQPTQPQSPYMQPSMPQQQYPPHMHGMPQWAYPCPSYTPFPVYCPMPMYPQNCGQPPNTAALSSQPQHAVNPPVAQQSPASAAHFNALTAKLNGILNKIESVERNIGRLESTVKGMQTDGPSSATTQILQGLIQSHMRLKEDHGEILDRVCKAVVETNHIVKKMPQKE